MRNSVEIFNEHWTVYYAGRKEKNSLTRFNKNQKYLTTGEFNFRRRIIEFFLLRIELLL